MEKSKKKKLFYFFSFLVCFDGQKKRARHAIKSVLQSPAFASKSSLILPSFSSLHSVSFSPSLRHFSREPPPLSLSPHLKIKRGGRKRVREREKE